MAVSPLHLGNRKADKFSNSRHATTMAMTRKNERWSEQDVALVKARQGFARAVKTLPVGATIARTYSFMIPGLAQPGGSKQAFVPLNKKEVCNCGPKPLYKPYRRPNGGIMANVVDANSKVGKWRKHVDRIAHEEYSGPLFDGALKVTFIFYRPRPACHYNSTGGLSKEGRENPFPTSAPDTTKLVRATEDALQGLCWANDAIIVRQEAWKEYGYPPRVEITIEELIVPEPYEQPALFEAPAPWETKK